MLLPGNGLQTVLKGCKMPLQDILHCPALIGSFLCNVRVNSPLALSGKTSGERRVL